MQPPFSRRRRMATQVSIRFDAFCFRVRSDSIRFFAVFAISPGRCPGAPGGALVSRSALVFRPSMRFGSMFEFRFDSIRFRFDAELFRFLRPRGGPCQRRDGVCALCELCDSWLSMYVEKARATSRGRGFARAPLTVQAILARGSSSC